jgi:ribose-phosphate pyrophosphokinase
MFYKRRDYSVIVNGKNPIVAHEYLGRDVEGKDVIIVDDMISSGDSILDVAQQLKNKGAKRIFVFSTFGLFCNGYANIDKAYAEGVFTRIFTTNLVYREPELLEKEWYSEVNMCKYVAYIIDTLNHDQTISHLLDQSKKIHAVLDKHNKNNKK